MSLIEGRGGREAAGGVLASARYGKDKVRVFRVVRDAASKVHDVVEYNVTVLVEGAIETSFTRADNTVVVATDSSAPFLIISYEYYDLSNQAIMHHINIWTRALNTVKNIVNYLAKVSPHVLYPARFGLHIAVHLLSRYAHLTTTFVTVEQLRWARIGTSASSDGDAGGGGNKSEGHKHAFWRDGTEKRFVEVEMTRKSDVDGAVARVAGGLRDLLVLKSTGSAFENFVRDEYTTLVEVDDRIFSTSVDLTYTYGEVGVKLPPRGTHEDQGPSALDFGEETFDKSGTGVIHPWEDTKIGARARETTLDVFAHDESASVQATLYEMAQRVLAENAGVESVRYVLPNKHYIPVDMKYIGVDNTTPRNAEVFTPVDAPSGLISATISRR